MIVHYKHKRSGSASSSGRSQATPRPTTVGSRCSTRGSLVQGEHVVDCYLVRYKVEGFDGERTSEVYKSLAEAERQADDIRGYEGVLYANVEPAEPLVEEAIKATST